MCLESAVCSTSANANSSCSGESVGCLKGDSQPRRSERNAALWHSCAAPSCTEEEEDTGRAYPVFYGSYLKEHAQDGLAAMNCNHRQKTKTINKQIGFLEASSVPLTRPGWSLPMRQAVFSSEIRLWSTTPSLIYSCWFAVCMFGYGCVWLCVCVCVCVRERMRQREEGREKINMFVCVCVCVCVQLKYL